MKAWLRTMGMGMGLILFPSWAGAHAFDPNVLQLHEQSSSKYYVTWASSSPSGGLPSFGGGCRTESQASSSGPQGRRTTSLRLHCEAPLRALGFADAAADSDAIVRLHRRDGSMWTGMARAGGDRLTIPVSGQAPAVVAPRYLTLGVEHILLGVDHLAFVLALFLLVRSRRTLVSTLTAFTLAHSLTLAAVTMQIVRVGSGPVEVLIALSIVLLAAEIASGRSGSLSRRPWLAAGAFGLLHGFGFAGALGELGLPPGQVGLALAAFNLGVELGQLFFVAVLMGIGFAFRARWSSPTLVPRLLGYGVGIAAALWTGARAASLGA